MMKLLPSASMTCLMFSNSISILIRNPFNLEYEDALAIAGYLIEDHTSGHQTTLSHASSVLKTLIKGVK